jgi:hydrogenase/urease accessory protein HupE
MIRAWFAALILVVAAFPAAAHPPPLGIGGFAGGLLHPLFVPAHMLAVLALGLLIGQQSWTRTAALSFIAGLAAGLLTMTLGVVPALMTEVVLACALIAGLLVALVRPVPEFSGCAFAALAGYCIALDSPPEAISLTEANLMLLGTGIGGALLLIVVAAVASRLMFGWARVAARILGSWIAASAILVLALRLVR